MSIQPLKQVPRHTARGIVVSNGQILLMERWRPGLHYFSIPGGGIEYSETAEQTVVREIAEETSLIISVERQVIQMIDGPITHHIFLCRYISGQPSLPIDAPEALIQNPDNRFQPGWFPVEDLTNLPFTYWQPLQQPLIDGLKDGFDKQIKIVTAGKSA